MNRGINALYSVSSTIRTLLIILVKISGPLPNNTIYGLIYQKDAGKKQTGTSHDLRGLVTKAVQEKKVLSL